MKVKKEFKNKLKKVLKRWLIMAIVIMFIVLVSGHLFSKKQVMNKLDYNIIVNQMVYQYIHVIVLGI